MGEFLVLTHSVEPPKLENLLAHMHSSSCGLSRLSIFPPYTQKSSLAEHTGSLLFLWLLFEFVKEKANERHWKNARKQILSPASTQFSIVKALVRAPFSARHVYPSDLWVAKALAVASQDSVTLSALLIPAHTTRNHSFVTLFTSTPGGYHQFLSGILTYTFIFRGSIKGQRTCKNKLEIDCVLKTTYNLVKAITVAHQTSLVD